jgi:hypothetical protein
MKSINFLGPKQVYFISNDKIVFQSYNKVICTIENYQDGNEPVIKITAGQPQSKTTAKYLNAFLTLHTSVRSYKELVK